MSIERHTFVQCTSCVQEVEVFLDNLRGTARLSITQNERWLNYKGIQGNSIQHKNSSYKSKCSNSIRLQVSLIINTSRGN